MRSHDSAELMELKFSKRTVLPLHYAFIARASC
jgi:hypothetical protein